MIKAVGYKVNYTVSFNSNDGSTVDDITEVPYNSTITALSDPVKPGFVFGGWYKEKELVNRWDFDNDKVTSDITLYAKWTINSYTLVYRAGANGSIRGNTTQTVNRGGSGTTVTAVPDTGYRFVRWSDGVTTASRTDTNVTGNIEVTAEFEINTYTATFDSNGGSIVSSQTVPYNTTAAEPETPAREGCMFEGWYSDSTLSTRFDFSTPITGDITLYAKREYNPEPEDDQDQAKTITVTEVTNSLFAGNEGLISASANMENAFSSSVEVKISETDVDKESFSFSIADEVFSFDISLYIKGTDQKTKPAPGYSVTISLPVPENLLSVKEGIIVVHISESGVVTVIPSRLEQKDGTWYITFEATEFSPYALVVKNSQSYDESEGVPYYLDARGNKVFIGFAANGRYIASEGVIVHTTQKKKSFTDIYGHWAQGYIDFVTEREIFLGTGNGNFSPGGNVIESIWIC